MSFTATLTTTIAFAELALFRKIRET